MQELDSATVVNSAVRSRSVPGNGMPRAVRRLPAGAVAAGCAVGSLAAVPGVASASARNAAGAAPVKPGFGYLALGDSVTFGYEEPQVVPAPDYGNAASFLGYPEQLGSELHLKVVNASCPGETSSSLIDASAQSNGCENSVSPSAPSYRTLSRSTCITRALSWHTPLVLVTSATIVGSGWYR